MKSTPERHPHAAHILFYAEADGCNQDSKETGIISSPNPTGKTNGKV